MAEPPKAGAVVYAKQVPLVAAFYRDVGGLVERSTDPGYVQLESPSLQVVVVQIPPDIAETIDIRTPPERRSETAVKLLLPVASIATARATAVGTGGVVDPADHEWSLDGCIRCDGHDPEGNVVQVVQAG